MKLTRLAFAASIFLSFLLLSSAYALPQAQQDPQWNIGLSPNIQTYFSESTWVNSSVEITVTSLWRNNWFNYTVSGSGTQQIHNGSKPSTVYVDGVAKLEGDGWSYTDGTVTVTGATNNASLYWGTAPSGVDVLVTLTCIVATASPVYIVFQVATGTVPSATTTLTLLIQAMPLLLLAGMVLLAVAMIKKFNLYLLIGLVLLIILFATVMSMIGGLT